MTMDQKLSDAELARQASQAADQAATAQAELDRRQHERATTERQDRESKARQTLDVYKSVEAKITADGVAAESQGLDAVKARDFSAALGAWMAYVASRAARQSIRDVALEAHLILGSDSQHGIAEVRQYTGTFSSWFDELAEKVARQEGYEQGRAAMGVE